MPARRLSLRKLREVLRLRYELKLGYQQIGRNCASAVSTVHKYLTRAEAADPSFKLHRPSRVSAPIRRPARMSTLVGASSRAICPFDSQRVSIIHPKLMGF